MAKKKSQRGPRPVEPPDRYPVTFPPGLRQQLEKLAAENDRSLNGEIMQAIKRYLREQTAAQPPEEPRV